MNYLRIAALAVLVLVFSACSGAAIPQGAGVKPAPTSNTTQGAGVKTTPTSNATQGAGVKTGPTSTAPLGAVSTPTRTIRTISPPALTALAPTLPVGVTPAAPLVLNGTLWSFDGGTTKVSLAFEDGRISGQGPCNSYFATYSQDGFKLSFGIIGATKMNCQNVMQEETAYFTNLKDTVSYKIDKGFLILYNFTGQPIMRFYPTY